MQDNKTADLWQRFGPRKKEIEERADDNSYSLQLYGPEFLNETFLPITVFEKWAAVQVNGTSNIPEGMQVLYVSEGQWAVFTYTGTVLDFGVFAKYIYDSWLPSTGFELDTRPHYESMAPDYLGPMHPEATEEVWIPIK